MSITKRVASRYLRSSVHKIDPIFLKELVEFDKKLASVYVDFSPLARLAKAKGAEVEGEIDDLGVQIREMEKLPDAVLDARLDEYEALMDKQDALGKFRDVYEALEEAFTGTNGLRYHFGEVEDELRKLIRMVQQVD